MGVTITSESTWAQGRLRSQGRLRYFPLVPGNKLLTPWQRLFRRTPSLSTASPCVDSTPRCPSKGVWDILYYDPYVTATYVKSVTVYVTTVFRIRIVFSVRITSLRFRGVPFWGFKWLGLNVTITFFKMILVNNEVCLYLDPKCNDVRDKLSCKLSNVWTLV